MSYFILWDYISTYRELSWYDIKELVKGWQIDRIQTNSEQTWLCFHAQKLNDKYFASFPDVELYLHKGDCDIYGISLMTNLESLVSKPQLQSKHRGNLFARKS